MLYNVGAACRLLVLSLAVARGVLGQSCGDFSITSDADAEAARRCPDISGHVLIYGDNITDVNLDGVQNISGTLALRSNCGWWWTNETDFGFGCTRSQLLRSVSSSTLKTIGSSFSMASNASVTNLSFPKLATVGQGFRVEMESLEYLDITSLEAVRFIDLYAPKLTTMKHENLRKLGDGDKRSWMNIKATSLESIDSLFRSPLVLGQLRIGNSPKLRQITLGIESAATVRIEGDYDYQWFSDVWEKNNRTKGDMGSARLILGTSESGRLDIGQLYILNSTATIERAPEARQVTVRDVFIDGNHFMEHLALPFDKLTRAYVKRTPALRWLSNTPDAVGWESYDLILNITDTPALNLSSEYMIDDKGDLVRSWYWPRSGMQHMTLTGILGNDFFDSLPEVRSSYARWALNLYNYGPSGSLNCKALEKKTSVSRCENLNNATSSSTRQATTGGWGFLGLCWSAVLWLSYF